jgi:hypothetical protein
MAYKQYSGDRMSSPLKQNISIPPHHRDRLDKMRKDHDRRFAEQKSEWKHEGKYADREKEMLLAKAERKEKKAAEKEAKGRMRAAERKRRKAAKLRERAENATGHMYEKQAVNDDMRHYDMINRTGIYERRRPTFSPQQLND